MNASRIPSEPEDLDDLGPAYDREWAALLDPTYPRTLDGRTVWACCISEIGPECPHRADLSQVGTAELNALLDEQFPDNDWDRDRRTLARLYTAVAAVAAFWLTAFVVQAVLR